MASAITLGVVLTAYDKISKPINDAVTKAQAKLAAFGKSSKAFAEDAYHSGKEFTAAGLAVGVPLYKAISSYAELEDAQLSLKSTMMDANGKVLPVFDQLNQKAIELGNLLPGTTKDFYEMFDTMIRNGGDANDIVNGVGKSAAYMAVQLKIPYAEAGELATRLKAATGVANDKMQDFMDTLSRINEVGAKVPEMRYAFQNAAGALKAMNIQGIEDTTKLGTVFAMLIKTMGSGEKVGTGFSSLLSAFENPKAMQKMQDAAKGWVKGGLHFTDATGNFLGIDNMIGQLDKLKNLTTAKREEILAPLGKGPSKKITEILIAEGQHGYDTMQGLINKQASLDTKVNSQLGSLKNMWEAVTGSMENTAATLGSTLAPGLKGLFDKLNNKYLPALTNFIEKHPVLVKRLVYAAAAFTALAFAGAYLSFAVSGLSRLFSITSFAMKYLLSPLRLLTMGKWKLFRAIISLKNGFAAFRTGVVGAFNAIRAAVIANPIILIIAAIAVAAFLIIKYWTPIKKFFIGIWDSIKGYVLPVLDVLKKAFLYFSPIGWIILLWKPIMGLVKAIFEFVKTIVIVFFGIWKWLFLNLTPIGWIIKHWAPISSVIKKILKVVIGIVIGFGVLLYKIFIEPWVKIGKAIFDWGVNIMKSLVKGIKSGIKWVTDAIHSATQAIRDFFPFSPAKTGPLKDIHKIRLVETIADTIKPNALVKAMKRTTGAVLSVVNKGADTSGIAGSRHGGTITANFNIRLYGGATEKDKNVLKKEIQRCIVDLYKNGARTNFMHTR